MCQVGKEDCAEEMCRWMAWLGHVANRLGETVAFSRETVPNPRESCRAALAGGLSPTKQASTGSL